MRILWVLLGLIFPLAASATLFGGAAAPETSALPVPVVIQGVSSSTNPTTGIVGNNFVMPLPNAVQTGDALVLAITYPQGQTPTITDNLGAGNASQTWPSSCVTVNNSGKQSAAIYVFPNTANGGGTTTPNLEVSFGSTVKGFQYDVLEVSNIASSSPCNGTVSATGITSSGNVISPGSLTPTTNNDANGGNLIFSYMACASNPCTNSPTISQQSGYTPFEADNAWQTASSVTFPTASQYLLQTTSGATTPSFSIPGDTSDPFNILAVALKVGSGGGSVPAGLYINKILHLSTAANSYTGSMVLQVPTTGNLRIFTPLVANPDAMSGVTSSDTCGGSSNFVTKSAIGTGANIQNSYIFYQQNCPPNPNLQITVAFSGTPTFATSMRFYDIQGAQASSFDTSATSQAASTSGSSITASPSITCSSSGELTIGTVALFTGPGLAVTAPSGAVFDLMTYAGETDSDQAENADLLGHLYNSPNTAQSWSWTITNNGTATVAIAACFK